jgi:peptidoglycan/xylan/chitin deacetylase (PgdA/CDA1 family)
MMKVLITLDYELFFGPNAGTVERSILEPTEALLRIAADYAIPMVFFVDAGYLVRMTAQYDRYPDLKREYEKVRGQLRRLVSQGHEVQLHIHPHWQDSEWDGNQWVMRTHRFRLHDFDPAEIDSIVRSYKAQLVETTGYESISAYRAGGLDVQPFAMLASALRNSGILIDSSVCAGVINPDGSAHYDFINSPNGGMWRFSDDVLKEDQNGKFLEVPISSMKIPAGYKLFSAISKRMRLEKHRPWGDGTYMQASKTGRLRNMLGDTLQPVTIDGFKSVILKQAYKLHQATGKTTFVILGHPKAVTPFALKKLCEFLRDIQPEVCGFNDLLERLVGFF